MYTIECVLLAFAGVCLANNTDFRVGGLGELRDATPKNPASRGFCKYCSELNKLSFFIFYAKVVVNLYSSFNITNRCEMISMASFPWDTTGSDH